MDQCVIKDVAEFSHMNEAVTQNSLDLHEKTPRWATGDMKCLGEKICISEMKYLRQGRLVGERKGYKDWQPGWNWAG